MFGPSSMSPVYVLDAPGQNPFSPRKKPRGEKDSRRRVPQVRFKQTVRNAV